jgi:lysophospholipase L1-like esterase
MKIAFKALAAFLLAVIVWEVILQLCFFRLPFPNKVPVLGPVERHGLVVEGIEGYTMTRMNSLGMRGEDEPVPKQPGEFRILVLGDSQTEGNQVADSETYCSQLQRLLQSRTNRTIHVINAGRSNASPAYYIHLAKYYNTLLSPDIVVIQLDESDYTKDIFNPENYFYVSASNGHFQTIEDFDQRRVTGGQGRLAVLKRLSTSLLARRRWGQAVASKTEKVSVPHSINQPNHSTIDSFQSIIDWTLMRFQQNYAKPVVLYLPDLDYNHIGGSPSRIETELENAALKHGLPLINMRDDFIKEYRATRQPLHGFFNTMPGTGHMNGRGHRLAAQRLTEVIEGMLPK